MKFLFLVTSAIKHFQEEHFSLYAENERFNQTLDTIQSIRNKVENSYVVLVECSHTSLCEDHVNTFKEKCDLFFDFSNDPVLTQIYSNIQEDYRLIVFGKSMLEARGLLKALYTIGKNNYFNDSQRVFKLTGRYLLNDSFNILDYHSKFLENTYVIKKYDYSSLEKQNYNDKDLSNIHAYLFGLEGMMITGLWSFDRLLFNDVIHALENAFSYMEKMIQYTTGADIEHSLYRFLKKENILGVPNLGLTVIKGMSGDNSGIYDI